MLIVSLKSISNYWLDRAVEDSGTVMTSPSFFPAGAVLAPRATGKNQGGNCCTGGGGQKNDCCGCRKAAAGYCSTAGGAAAAGVAGAAGAAAGSAPAALGVRCCSCCSCLAAARMAACWAANWARNCGTVRPLRAGVNGMEGWMGLRRAGLGRKAVRVVAGAAL